LKKWQEDTVQWRVKRLIQLEKIRHFDTFDGDKDYCKGLSLLGFHDASGIGEGDREKRGARTTERQVQRQKFSHSTGNQENVSFFSPPDKKTSSVVYQINP